MSDKDLPVTAVIEKGKAALVAAFNVAAEELGCTLADGDLDFEVDFDSDTEALIEVTINGYLEGQLYVDADGGLGWASTLTEFGGGYWEPPDWVDEPIEDAMGVSIVEAAEALAGTIMSRVMLP